MPFFYCKLVPPRPTFASDMSAQEASLMGRHVAYGTGPAAEGAAVIHGPVADPAGMWGLGILDADDEDQARGVLSRDPVAAGEIGMRWELMPIPRGTAREGGRAPRADPAPSDAP